MLISSMSPLALIRLAAIDHRSLPDNRRGSKECSRGTKRQSQYVDIMLKFPVNLFSNRRKN